MNNLIVTIFGGLMIIAGFYSMWFGFAIPPNILLFILGLILAVAGLFVVIIFSSAAQTPKRVSPAQKPAPSASSIMKARPKPVKVEKKVSEEKKKKETLETLEKIKPEPRIKKPKKVDRPDVVSNKEAEVETPQQPSENIGAREIKPEKKSDIGESSASPPTAAFKSSTSPETEKSTEFKPEPPVEKVEPTKPAEPTPRIRRPVKAEKPKEPAEPQKPEEPEKPPVTEPEGKEGMKPITPVKTGEEGKPPLIKRPNLSKLKSSKSPENEEEYVKKRLEKMKESYLQNTQDIDSIIDERMDSFKGTLGKLKTESKEPGIIWSFDAGDVQEAMKDTISRANNKILMMYPWIRNIDVGILKKFMETESSIIVQEASLDDDASVELLKLLQDKNVKIRTMPHVHTIAVVADESNGLIISTDPIYESYEVGVIYKDQKSIEEIERMFEDAWEISQEVDLEIK